MSGEPISSACSRRKALSVAVSALCAETGFQSADKLALETLTEIMQSCKFRFFEVRHSFMSFAVLIITLEYAYVLSMPASFPPPA